MKERNVEESQTEKRVKLNICPQERQPLSKNPELSIGNATIK
jgi:hypothetical protein